MKDYISKSISKIHLTLLDDSFPGNVGHWEHGIKYVAAEETDSR